MILNEYFDMKMRKMYECVVCGCVEMFLFGKKKFFFNTMSFFAPYHYFLPYFWFFCIHSLSFKLWDLLSFLS